MYAEIILFEGKKIIPESDLFRQLINSEKIELSFS